MKFFSLLLFFTSVNAFACPNLAGNYSCKDQNDTWNMSITQNTQNGAAVYQQITGNTKNTYVADGVARPYTAQGEGYSIPGTLSTTCSGETVTNHFLGKMQGHPIDGTETITMAGGKLKVQTVATMNGEEVNSSQYECTPTN